MSYFGRLRIPAETDGARKVDGFLESAADVVRTAQGVDGWSDETLAEALLHVVKVGAALGAVATTTGPEDRMAPATLRATQWGVTVVSAEIVREISLRDDERNRQPPELELLLARVRERYPALFNDQKYMYGSGLELDPASPVSVEGMLAQPWDEAFPEALRQDAANLY